MANLQKQTFRDWTVRQVLKVLIRITARITQNLLFRLHKMPLKKPLFILIFLQTAINAVVGVEVACWFFIGECIGKGSLVSFLEISENRMCFHIF